jgi:hypothetical protein
MAFPNFGKKTVGSSGSMGISGLVWVGSSGITTRLHFDLHAGFICAQLVEIIGVVDCDVNLGFAFHKRVYIRIVCEVATRVKVAD